MVVVAGSIPVAPTNSQGETPCRLSRCLTAPNAVSTRPSRSPKSRSASAPGWRARRSAARSTASWSTRAFRIEQDATLAIVTERDPEGLEIIRHSTAHLLAQAVKQLYPDTQVTIGPVIEDGFFYDFSRKTPFTTEDLAKIEARMLELAKADQPVRRRELARDAAVEHFRNHGENYKAEIIEKHSRGREYQPLRPGRLGRSVPRPARAIHRQAQGLQADEGRRRLLARRFAQRDAAADLRHRVARPEAA